MNAETGRSQGLTVVTPEQRETDNEHGFVRGWGVSASASGSHDISMAYGELPPGIKAAAHWHPFETAIYIVSGKVRVYYGEDMAEYVDVRGGDFLTIPADVPHGPENRSDTPMTYIVARAAAAESGHEI